MNSMDRRSRQVVDSLVNSRDMDRRDLDHREEVPNSSQHNHPVDLHSTRGRLNNLPTWLDLDNTAKAVMDSH